MAAPVSGWRMLKASPSSSAPARCSGAAGMLLFCIVRTRPDSTASRNAPRSFAGTCQQTLALQFLSALIARTAQLRGRLPAGNRAINFLGSASAASAPTPRPPGTPRAASQAPASRRLHAYIETSLLACCMLHHCCWPKQRMRLLRLPSRPRQRSSFLLDTWSRTLSM